MIRRLLCELGSHHWSAWLVSRFLYDLALDKNIVWLRRSCFDCGKTERSYAVFSEEAQRDIYCVHIPPKDKCHCQETRIPTAPPSGTVPFADFEHN